MNIEIERIKRDPTLQVREDGLDMERVEDMVEAMTDGVTMPPVTVVGSENLLADGFHRVYAAKRAGQDRVEANRVAGDYNTALAIAIRANSTGAKQLTRTERNAAIKRLLIAGWTEEQIAKETGLHRTTIANIREPLIMKGEVAPVVRPAGGRPTKPVAVLPKASPARELKDTTLTRIASGVPVDQQVEFAEAAAATRTRDNQPLPEPRVREAIRTLKANPGMAPAEAVRLAAPSQVLVPTTVADAIKHLTDRVDRFDQATARLDERDMTIWEVIAFITQNAQDQDREQAAQVLADLAVRLDLAASALRTGKTIKVMKAVSA